MSAFSNAQWAYDRQLPEEDRPLCDGDCGGEADPHPWKTCRDEDDDDLCLSCRKAQETQQKAEDG